MHWIHYPKAVEREQFDHCPWLAALQEESTKETISPESHASSSRWLPTVVQDLLQDVGEELIMRGVCEGPKIRKGARQIQEEQAWEELTLHVFCQWRHWSLCSPVWLIACVYNTVHPCTCVYMCTHTYPLGIHTWSHYWQDLGTQNCSKHQICQAMTGEIHMQLEAHWITLPLTVKFPI